MSPATFTRLLPAVAAAMAALLCAPARAQPGLTPVGSHEDEEPPLIEPTEGDDPGAEHPDRDSDDLEPGEPRPRGEAPPEAPALPPLRPSPGPIANPTSSHPYPPLGVPSGRTHHGFFFQAALGLGVQSFASGGKSYPQASQSMFIAVGGSIRQDVLIFGALDYSLAFFESPSTYLSMERGGFGAGAACYFSSNLYASGTVMAPRMELVGRGQNPDIETGFGVGLRGAFGKEWWFSDNWGLGVAGYLSVGSLPDAPDGRRWTTIDGGVAFSATYN